MAINANYKEAVPFLYEQTRLPGSFNRWSPASRITGANFVMNGGIAFAPDNDTLLIATAALSTNSIERGPYSVGKYRLSEIISGKIGIEYGALEFPAPIGEIIIDAMGKLAYAVSVNGILYPINIDTMTESSGPIAGHPVDRRFGPVSLDVRAMALHAAISADGRYIVANTWDGNGINVYDLQSHASSFITFPSETIGGVAFNHANTNHGLLAVHRLSRVGVYRIEDSKLAHLASISIAPVRYLQSDSTPLASVAWSGDGKHLIAATDQGQAEFRVIDVGEDGRLLTNGTLLTACPAPPNEPNLPGDILTTNRLRLPTPTPSSSPLPTSPTPPPPSSTPSSPPPPTANPSPTPTSIATASPTPAPRPIYLPLTLREHCTPDQQRLDIALVLDASTSMLEPTSAGRTKLEAATEAARVLLDVLQLDASGGDGDQTALVAFNAEAALLQPLTNARVDLYTALAGIVVAQQTRIDLGIRAAADELASGRHIAGHTAVLIVLTDGRANPVPADVAVANAAAAKAAGIVVHTVGVGSDLDIEALQAMASSAATFHLAPDAEQLVGIYRDIAVALPCAGRYWPGARSP